MFETMSSFLWFFFIGFGLIILGIIFEDKLIRFEQAVKTGVRQTIQEWRAAKIETNT